MTRRKLLSLLVLALVMTSLALPALAQGDISVISQSADYHFSRELIFELTAESSSEIGPEDLLLFYKVGVDGARNRREPEYEPGTRVEAQYVEPLQRGQIPPGSEIEYFWRIQDAAGNSVKTETMTFIYMDDRFDWQSLSEGKVQVYWYGADQAFGQKMLRAAVAALTRLESKVGVELQEPIKVLVYQSKGDMQEALINRGETFESQIITLGTVVAPNIMLLHGTHSEVEQTIAHELTHVVVGLATDNPYGDIPAWLNEGLAMYNEGQLRRSNRQALDRAIRENRLDSVRSLTSPTGNPSQVNLWYGEVYSIVEYLLETYGREKMAELLQVFSEGADYDDALTRVYGFDQTELDARWRAWLGAPPREKVQPVTPEAKPEKQAQPEPPPVERPPERAPAGGICGGLFAALGVAVAGVWRARSMSARHKVEL